MNYNVPQGVQPQYNRPVSSVGRFGNEAGLTSIPGYPGVGITIPFQPGTGADLDPITPGIQNTPGIVTATGPPRVIHPGASMNNPIGSVESSGFMIGGNISHLPRAHQMGIINGPLSLLENHVVNDPIAPPLVVETKIQTQIINPPSPQTFIDTAEPLLITQPQIATSPFTLPHQTSIIPVADNNILQMSLMQTQGGIVQKRPPCNIKWWVWALIGLLLLGVLIAGLFFAFRPRNRFLDYPEDYNNGLNYDRTIGNQCQNGFMNMNGRCIRCPDGTIWNGKYYGRLNQVPSTYPQDFQSRYNQYDPNSRFKRLESINTSWSTGNRENINDPNGFSSGSTSKLINSVAEVKKIIVPPIIEDPVSHLKKNR